MTDDFKCNWHDCDNYQVEDEFYCGLHLGRIEGVTVEEFLRKEDDGDSVDSDSDPVLLVPGEDVRVALQGPEISSPPGP